VEVLAPIAEAPNSSVPVRRAYNVVLNFLGYLNLRDSREVEAIPILEKARAAAKSIADLKITDPSAMAAYAEPSAWEVEALFQAGRNAEAIRVGEEALQIDRELLEARPGHAQGLRIAGNISGSLGTIFGETGELSRGAQLQAESVRDWDALVRIDPSNVVARNNRAASGLALANLLQALGRPREQLAVNKETYAQLEPSVGQSTMLAGIVRFPANGILTLNADLGNVGALDADRALFKKVADRYAAMQPPGAFAITLNNFYYALNLLQVSQLQGDNDAVLRGIPALQAQIGSANPDTEGQRFLQHQMLRDAADMDAESAYATGNYSRAIADGQISTEHSLAMNPRKISDLRNLDDERSRLALAQARAGDTAAAVKLAEPVLGRQRALLARMPEDQQLRLELARTLLALAVAKPDSSRSLLEEAQRQVKSVPADMQHLASVSIWKKRIDEELRKRR
jgi:tetratricopeptide (TPR) repeat protein